MTTLVTLLTEGFADWETTLLNGIAAGFYNAKTLYATPGGRPVTSMGRMQVTPDIAIEDIDIAALDAIVVCGGRIWQTPEAPDLNDLLHKAYDAGKVVAVICDATVATAKTGLLDDVAHTSNGAGYLDGTGYRGKAHYRDVPYAVSDKRIITASASAPVTFAHEVLRAVGVGDDQLDYYIGLHARQFEAEGKAAA